MSAVSKRRLMTRLVLIASILVLAFIMYNIGKEFNVLLDNKTVTIDGREYQMVEYALLTIDDKSNKEIEIYADDRIIENVVGTNHKLVLKIMDEDQETVIKTVERNIKLDVDTKGWMISLAAIAGESENIFIPNPMLSDEAEEEQGEESPDKTDDAEEIPSTDGAEVPAQ